MRLETLSNDFPKCLKTLWYLFEVSQDAFLYFNIGLGTFIQKVTYVSRRIQNSFIHLTLSNDFPKCLKTLWYLFETSQDAFECVLRHRSLFE